LPRDINDFDFATLVDVRLTFYVQARFDDALAQRVKDVHAAAPGVFERQRGIPLRWAFPDAFFHFQETGELSISIRPSDFPANQTAHTLNSVGLFVVTDSSVAAASLQFVLSSPSTPGLAVPLATHADAQPTTAGGTIAASGPATGD